MKPLIIGMSKKEFMGDREGEAPDYINGVPVTYDPVNYGVVIAKSRISIEGDAPDL